MSVIGLIKALDMEQKNGGFTCLYCGDCQPTVVLVSRIIENEYDALIDFEFCVG